LSFELLVPDWSIVVGKKIVLEGICNKAGSIFRAYFFEEVSAMGVNSPYTNKQFFRNFLVG
jgi:hypothetical protein